MTEAQYWFGRYLEECKEKGVVPCKRCAKAVNMNGTLYCTRDARKGYEVVNKGFYCADGEEKTDEENRN